MSRNYIGLIKNWHIKAGHEDNFSKFMYEYLAFIAFLRTQKYSDEIVRSKMATRSSERKVSDRAYIQTLKQDATCRNEWLSCLASDATLSATVDELHSYLMQAPLEVDDKWWDNDTYVCHNQDYQSSGSLREVNDYDNLIEFFYTIRNNLFHGTKGPEIERDIKLVKFAYLILSTFVEHLFIKNFEKNRLYPFFGDEFIQKFFSGKAEVTNKPNGGGYMADIYEIFVMPDDTFPLLIENNVLTRNDLAEKVKFNLSNTYGVGDGQFGIIMSKLLSLTHGKPEKRLILENYIAEYLELYDNGER